MAEAEFISDLLLAMQDGIQAGAKAVLDSAYKKYDDEFPSRNTHEKRFRETIDAIAAIFGEGLAESEFSAIRLFYPMFCAVYHMKHGLPKMKTARKTFKVADYPKMSIALDNIDDLIARVKEAEGDHEDITLTADEKRFYDAFDEHWVHADKRTTLADYICRRLNKSLAG